MVYQIDYTDKAIEGLIRLHRSEPNIRKGATSDC